MVELKIERTGKDELLSSLTPKTAILKLRVCACCVVVVVAAVATEMTGVVAFAFTEMG